MPAFNFYPATYQNPYMYQPQQYTPQNSIIWVSGEREALAYPVAPNNAVTLWSQTEPVVYLKQADASGKPSVKTYDLVERKESVAPDKPDYAMKSDLTDVLSVIQGIKADIETMRSDIYGLAGKRRVKKEETEE